MIIILPFFSSVPVLVLKVIDYDLFVAGITVNFAGRTKHAIAGNGKISMPAQEFGQGGTAEIVLNQLIKQLPITFKNYSYDVSQWLSPLGHAPDMVAHLDSHSGLDIRFALPHSRRKDEERFTFGYSS